VQGEKQEIQNIVLEKITLNKPIDQKTAENMAGSFGIIANENDGRIVEIPINTIGKILRHKSYDYSRIINSLPLLFKTSILGWSENEIPKEGHKKHPNIKKYHHYINKFTDGDGEYYIRFTVNEANVKAGKTGKNLIHSVAISDIAIYEKGDGSDRFRLRRPGVKNASPFTDIKLIHFFNSVK